MSNTCSRCGFELADPATKELLSIIQKKMESEPISFLLVNAMRRGDEVMIPLMEALYERTDNKYKRRIVELEKQVLELLD